MALEYLVALSDGKPVLLVDDRNNGRENKRSEYSVAKRFDSLAALRVYIDRAKEDGWKEHFYYRAPPGWTSLSIADIQALDPEGTKMLRQFKNGAVHGTSR